APFSRASFSRAAFFRAAVSWERPAPAAPHAPGAVSPPASFPSANPERSHLRRAAAQIASKEAALPCGASFHPDLGGLPAPPASLLALFSVLLLAASARRLHGDLVARSSV